MLMYWGRRLNIPKQELLHTRTGEILDMIACDAIAHGAAQKREKRAWTFDEVMKLR